MAILEPWRKRDFFELRVYFIDCCINDALGGGSAGFIFDCHQDRSTIRETNMKLPLDIAKDGYYLCS